MNGHYIVCIIYISCWVDTMDSGNRGTVPQIDT